MFEIALPEFRARCAARSDLSDLLEESGLSELGLKSVSVPMLIPPNAGQEALRTFLAMLGYRIGNEAVVFVDLI